MPFMKGNAPIRRTLKYLEAGKLVFKEGVKIFSINYNTSGPHHKGARDFVFWYVPQIQYKNPEVQVITFKNMTPSPFIRCFLDSGKELLVDIDSRSKEEVHSHIRRVLCKTDEQLAQEAVAMEKKDNPANFGKGYARSCICEIPGQVPCPGVVPLPNHMRGKFKHADNS
ncbi:hypothetical protein J437_LFUL007900 [Ladona fulva]|uniref:Small ribosomal subunit protein mS25 n=1 Tax=Ladona fulva TaxID=123851 RepID=A0A8K0K9L7_LADFU|nr:hypothetical protein J437_LFUL007900 [Ladona fulva]